MFHYHLIYYVHLLLSFFCFYKLNLIVIITIVFLHNFLHHNHVWFHKFVYFYLGFSYNIYISMYLLNYYNVCVFFVSNGFFYYNIYVFYVLCYFFKFKFHHNVCFVLGRHISFHDCDHLNVLFIFNLIYSLLWGV